MKHGLKLTALALSLLFLAGALLACVPAPNAAVRTFGDHLKSERDARQQQAEADFADDPTVRHFLDEGAHIRPDSIRPR